jgi:hypothetical protein
MKRITITLLLVAFAQAAMAGGTSVPVQMLELRETGKDEYVLKYKTLDTEDYRFENLPRNTLLTVHLSFAKDKYASQGDYLTYEKYKKAIELLKSQVEAKQIVRFGRMGGGFCVVKGKPNTYKSDALAIYEEDHPHKNQKWTVVYSYCNYQ